MEISKEELMEELKGVQRIVINDCYGGFGLSERAIREYSKLTGMTVEEIDAREIPRNDPYLVRLVRELGMGANGAHSNLKIVDVPGDVQWEIAEYDGAEWVAEKHRTWQ